MKKSLFILFLAFMASIGTKAQITADWSVHMPFDEWPIQVIETPGRVYFTSRTFEHRANLPSRNLSSLSLFYYDKEGDEIVSINERAQASGNAVACIGYNFDAKYLLVVYTDCSIDFIYDDGRIFNLYALTVTSIPGKKAVNSITFDNSRHTAYLATSFGYLALNDNKHEVAESRNYGKDISSVARCGDNIVLCYDGKLFSAPASGQRFNLEDYSQIEDSRPYGSVLPASDGNFYAFRSGNEGTPIKLFKWKGGKYEAENCFDDNNVICAQRVAGGYKVSGNSRIYSLNDNGTFSAVNRPQEEYGKPASGLTDNDLWTLTERKGLRSYKQNGSGWALTRDYMRPNSPATYISTSLYYHPEYGMLAGSHGIDLALSEFDQSPPCNISVLKDGFWKEYGPNYTAAAGKFHRTHSYTGLAVDPQNKNIIYRSSSLGGLMRINLANPSDMMIFANPSNANAPDDGFVKVADDLNAWNILCRLSTPSFSTDGTLWTLYNNADKERAELWYWPSADRLATTSAATYRPMKKIEVPLFTSSNDDVMTTLTKNKNIIAIGGFSNYGTVMFYDHNGTPDVTSDDRYVHLTDLYDQDGGGVAFQSVNNLREDPATGLVWILSQRGVFTVNPATVFEDPTRVNRIKVARNDGTNLADYLLNEINVFDMIIDGEGRKWFTTSNGIVCTSQDGRQILGEFTTENSYLPSDVVYTACFNPSNHSLMVATDGGLVEMFPSGSGSSSAESGSEMRVYPNPVEPDFYGWVRIDNIADGSLVKITDSKGGLVRELGPAQGGSVQWDVSGLNNSRVSTGVYYIMVSPGSSGDGKAQIAKILVLN